MESAGSSATIFICHECDALQQVTTVLPGNDAICVRCGSCLFRNPKGGIDKPLALIMASMIIFIVANIYPIMTLTIMGVQQATTISGAAIIFMQQGSPELAAIVWLPSVLIPGLIISGLFYVLFSIRFQKNWYYTKPMLAWISRMLPWGMMDVFFLGVLVSLVKLVALADIVLGTGFYAFVLLVLLYAATIASLEPHTLWESLRHQTPLRDKVKNG
ncbi:MAG: paraquat-inducible protein A [Gammaproteobacteria bacterium]|nr:paraquat-inducible protein A [Gammaproteobacteria bacterium]